jgi:hypothetical protein
MNIRFFFIKDQVDSKRVKIEHCPTAEMLADFFTKPLQGTQFRKLRDHILNIVPSSTHHSNNSCQRSVLKPTDGVTSDDVTTDDTSTIEHVSTTRSYKDVLLGKKEWAEKLTLSLLLASVYDTDTSEAVKTKFGSNE